MVERGISLRDIGIIEQAMFACRPSLETVYDGDWVWRYARGYTGRANSLQSLNVGDFSDVEKRLATHVQRSEDMGIVPRFRVTPLAGRKIIEVLDKQNWSKAGDTLVMVKQLVLVEPNEQMANEALAIAPASKTWRDAMVPLLGLQPDDARTYGEMMEKLPTSARGFLMSADDTITCGVLVSLVEKFGGVFSLTTNPQFRRAGLGRAMMSHVLNWLADNGANQVALQVEAHNEPAIALYRSLGFETAYSYHYRLLEKNNS